MLVGTDEDVVDPPGPFLHDVAVLRISGLRSVNVSTGSPGWIVSQASR